MGKFGANSKLSNTITVEPDEDDLIVGADGLKLTQLHLDFSQLAHSCLPIELRNNIGSNKLDSIVTSDFRIKVENNHYFNVHKVNKSTFISFHYLSNN